MHYFYEQAKDSRWTASGPAVSGIAQTMAGATAFSQGAVPSLPTVSTNGACQGISMWWIIKRALGDDFWTWFGASSTAAASSTRPYANAGEPAKEIKDVMHLQSSAKLSRKNNHEAAANYILSRTAPHLVKKRGLVLRRNIGFKMLGYEVTAAKGYAFIGFSKSGWGGHAVAAHVCGDGSVEFMDPNFGEWSCPDYKSFYGVLGWLGGQYGMAKLDTVEVQTLQRPG